MALRSREGAAAAIVVAFDLLELNGVDLRRQPFEERRTCLAALICQAARARDEPESAILFSVVFAENAADVLARACELGCEGLVSRHVSSVYHSGNSAGD